MSVLSVQKVFKNYNNRLQALDDISFTIEAGEVVALLGPNGAGKTTLINIINSLAIKTSGRVSIFGHDIDSETELAKLNVGVVPQEFNFFIFNTPFNILIDQAGYFGVHRSVAKQRAEKYLKLFELWDKRHQKAVRLSGGMKRRLMIARALMHEPQFLILDEPTAGVDISIRRSMWVFIRQLIHSGVTILLTTHYLEEAEDLCDRIIILNHGRIIEDNSKQALISQLKKESFVLDVRSPLSQVDDFLDVQVTVVDPHSLQVDLPKGVSMNQVFEHLSLQGIEVVSLRNKSNRLEELFLNYTSAG